MAVRAITPTALSGSRHQAAFLRVSTSGCNSSRARVCRPTVCSLGAEGQHQQLPVTLRVRTAAQSAACHVCLIAGVITLAAGPARAIDIQMVDPDVFKIRDEVSQNSFKKVDFAEIRQKQMENLSKRGTNGYDAECRVEESCLEKPKNLGEAVSRMFEIMNDSEMGMSSATKLEKMGMNPEERVNSGAYYTKDE